MRIKSFALPEYREVNLTLRRLFSPAAGRAALLLLLCFLLIAVAGCSETGEPEEKNEEEELIPLEQTNTVRHESKPQLDRTVPDNLETATFAMG